NSHRELGLDSVQLAAVAVALFDTALHIAAVAAHVPVAGGAAGAGHGVGSPNDADHEVAGLEPAFRWSVDDFSDRLVPQHQVLVARRRPAVALKRDLGICAADP